MKDIKKILIGVAVLAISYLIYDKVTYVPEIIEVPVEVIVEVPGVAGEIQKDTILIPVEVIVENPLSQELLEKYRLTKDSLEQLKLYKDAITTRVYKETFEDSIQRITVETSVQGKMLDQDIKYFVKPRTIVYDTVIDVTIPKRVKLLVGAEIGVPLINTPNLVDIKPIVKANFILVNKKDNAFSISFDTQGRGWLGYNIKL